jgi:hypothetical protein
MNKKLNKVFILQELRILLLSQVKIYFKNKEIKVQEALTPTDHIFLKR